MEPNYYTKSRIMDEIQRGVPAPERNPESLTNRLQQILSNLNRCEDKAYNINQAIESVPMGADKMKTESSPSLASLTMELIAVTSRLEIALDAALSKL